MTQPALRFSPSYQPVQAVEGAFVRRPVLVESAHGRRKNRSWKTMGDDEVAGAINAFIAERGITSMHGLRDQNDYMAVLVGKRGIRDMIVFCPGGRNKAPQSIGMEPLSLDAEADTKAGAGGPVPSKSDSRLDDGEIIALAQEAIRELGLQDLECLRRDFGELHEIVVSRGLAQSIVFEGAALGKIDATQEALPKPRERLEPASLSPERLRKMDIDELEISRESMYILICACCFKVGTPFPVLSGMKAAMPDLQAQIQRKLNGSQNRLLRRCWGKMIAEGAIGFNSNSSAASLNLTARVRDPELEKALGWASRSQNEAETQERLRAPPV